MLVASMHSLFKIQVNNVYCEVAEIPNSTCKIQHSILDRNALV